MAIVSDEQTFRSLKAPVQRVCALEMPVPFNEQLEAMSIPSAEQIAAAVKHLLH